MSVKPNVEAARDAAGHQIPPLVLEGHEPTLAALLAAVAHRTRVNTREIISPRRQPSLVRARTIYYWLAKHLTSKSLPQIGRSCGGRDHATVSHGIRRVDGNRDAYEPELSLIMEAALKAEECK